MATRVVSVRATQLIWNGSMRIRPGTVFDYTLEDGKKLPRCVEEVPVVVAPVVSLGKRERVAGKVSHMAKDVERTTRDS